MSIKTEQEQTDADTRVQQYVIERWEKTQLKIFKLVELGYSEAQIEVLVETGCV